VLTAQKKILRLDWLLYKRARNHRALFFPGIVLKWIAKLKIKFSLRHEPFPKLIWSKPNDYLRANMVFE
jgi:hypothetical protein